MKGVEARACGIAVYFPFVYPFYEENENNFGMTDRQGHAAALDGRLRATDPRTGTQAVPWRPAWTTQAIHRARVFGDEHEMVAVVYTGEPRAKAALKLGLRAQCVEGLDGRALNAFDRRSCLCPMDCPTFGSTGPRPARGCAPIRRRCDLWKIGQQATRTYGKAVAPGIAISVRSAPWSGRRRTATASRPRQSSARSRSSCSTSSTWTQKPMTCC